MEVKMLHEVLAKQIQIHESIIFGNWLEIAGRVAEIVIGVMLAFVLIRLNELCRLRRLP